MNCQKTVIVRDYTDQYVKPEYTKEDLQFASLRARRTMEQCERPHMVDLDSQKRFDEVETICDVIAMTYYGKMTVTVDYQFYQAYIELELDYVEFFHEVPLTAHNELTMLSEAADHIRITALPSKKFQIYLDLPYFIPIE